MSMHSYSSRQIANIIVSYVNEPATSRKKLLGSQEKEEIASVFAARPAPSGIFEVKKAFECPISLHYFQDAVLTGCGHTFDSPFFYENLEHNHECPFDRIPIEGGKLRPNHLVTELTQKIKGLLAAKEKLIKICLILRRRELSELECCFSNCLLTEAVSLPCGHNFNLATIIEFYRSSSGNYFCRFDYQPINIQDLKIDFKTARKAQKALKYIKQFNEAIVIQNIQKFKNFDARFRLDQEIIKVMRAACRCPIGGGSLKDPVVAACGHTFERASVKEGSICPYDRTEILDLVPNYIIKSHFEKMDQFDPAYGFEFVQTRKIEDPPTNPDLEKAGLIFYGDAALKFEDLVGVVESVGLITTIRKDGRTLWCSPLHSFSVRKFRSGTLQNFIALANEEGEDVSRNSKITLNVVNEVTPQQYLERSELKMDAED